MLGFGKFGLPGLPTLHRGIDQPIPNGPRADAYGFGDGLRRLPARNLPYDPLSTTRRQPGILTHVHPVLPWNLKLPCALHQLSSWFAHYNEVHPHKALGYRSPREFIAARGNP